MKFTIFVVEIPIFMMTRIFLISLFFKSALLFSQIDTLHYFPPLFGRLNVDDHYIAISTLSANNVFVDIKSGDGTLIQNVVVSAGNPSLTLLGSGSSSQGMIDVNGLNSVNASDGIVVTASEPVFANLRHVQAAQGLCLTGKGSNAMGTSFRSGHLYNNQNMKQVKAHFISVMATENNTVVDFSDFSQNVIFKNTSVSNNTSDPINVTLNQGESYVIAAYVNESGATGNRNDINGTKISSNKPIVVNTGSWLGGGTGNGRDIGVDQIIPVSGIGNEYVFKEGDGPSSNERPCVVAEYNNTQIFVNGGASPVATINAGEYYHLSNSSYASNGNIYINTSQPTYIYQSLSGTSSASNGLTFIPPIKCFGLKEVEISNINLVGVPTVSITSRAGANVYVNYSATPLTGALPVTGNPNWETYEVSGGTGNFHVSSDSTINVALLTLSAPRGSAGYFSGFSSFNEVERGDTSDFVMCTDSVSSFIKLNIEGPYHSITPTLVNPLNGGSITVNNVVNDTIYYSYQNNSPLGVVDSVELEVCKVLDCIGSQADTLCTTSKLVFTKYATINPGIGDSVVVCADTSSINLIDLVSGNPGTGYWVDEDESGLLFNGTFQTSLASPGIYHFSYIVNGQYGCYDSTIVTLNVFPLNSTECCPLDPDFLISNVSCNGGNNGFIQIIDNSAVQFSIDGGTTFQNSGNFQNLVAGTYAVKVELGSNCFFDTTIIITEPLPLTLTVDIDSVSCLGACDGELLVQGNGGVLPYNYQITGQSTQSTPGFTGLCAGNYGVTITDSHNCTVNTNSIISEPPLLSVILDSVIDETCGNANGSITVIANGGTPNYQYSLDNVNYQTSPVFLGLSAGTHLLYVKDFNNCTVQMSTVVNNQSGPVPFVDSLKDLSCFSGANGLAIIGVNGGTPGFQFTLDNGIPQLSNVFNTLIAGNHTVTVIDANGCEDSISFSLTEPTPLNLSVSSDSTTCFGDCNGQVYLEVSGSNPPYNYSIGGGLFSQNAFYQFDTIINLCAVSNSNVIIKDSLDCLINTFITINEPDSIQINTSPVDPTCFDYCDGAISVSASGGTGSFEYSIDNGLTFQSGGQFNNLCDGNYDISVRDINQCIIFDTLSIDEPAGFGIGIVNVVHTTCGNSGGEIEVEILGAVNPDYTFTNLTTGTVVTDPNTATFTNLVSGAYTIEAVDNSGCVDTMHIGVNDNSLTIVLTPVSVTNVPCYGDCTGSFTVSATGGIPPYQYSIDGGALGNSSTFSGLCAGQYLVLVQDMAGCIETIQLEITEPDELLFSENVTDLTCNSICTGQIDFFDISGGTLPYTFSIDNGLNYVNDSSFTNLCAGSYNLVVNDNNNCQTTAFTQISEPTALNGNYAAYNLTCNNTGDGIILLSASGGTPNYQYSIDNGQTYSSASTFTGLDASTYYIEISDNNNCTYTDSIVVTEPAPNVLTVTKTENICSDMCSGELILNTSGGTAPYLYSINNGVNFQSTTTFNNLCSGIYQLLVTDNNGCQISTTDSLAYIDTLTMNITSTDSYCNLQSGTIDIVAQGGTPGYTYSIDNLNYVNTNSFSSLNASVYDVSVKDVNSCLIASQVTISSFPPPVIDSVSTVLPCHGVCNGEIAIYASTGTGPYEFSIDGANFQSNSQFSNVCPGTYTVTVRDANGCTADLPYVLSEPDTISFNANVSPILCYGDNSAIINVMAQGGIGQLSYSINNSVPGSLNNFTQLGPGNYTIDITDGLGCTVQFDTIITQPFQMQLTMSATSPSCFGFCDGSLEAMVSGGTVSGSYNYTWSQFNSNTQLQNNVCAGLYSVVVQDDNGCSVDTVNFEVTQPDEIEIDSIQITGVDCYGLPSGSNIAAYPSGYLYSFDGLNFSVSNQINNLATGNYTVHVQDFNGCSGDSVEVYIPTPQPLIGYVNPDQVICPNDIVSVSAIPIGGVQPYQYNWNNGLNNQETFSESVPNDTIYFVEITDNNGCTVQTDTFTVTTSVPPAITVSNDTVVCSGEIVNLTATPDNLLENYYFNWSTGSDDTLYTISPLITSDTIISISITDECGQMAIDTIRVNLFPEPVFDFQYDSLMGCLPYEADIQIAISPDNIAGNIDWKSSLGTIEMMTNTNLVIDYSVPGVDQIQASYTSLDGCYYERIFDNYIKVSTSPVANFSYTPKQPDTYDENIQFINTSSDYSISNWTISSDEFTTRDLTYPIQEIGDVYMPLNACLEVSTADGCSDKICQSIQLVVDQQVYVPNAFTPDESSNSIFKVEGENIDRYGFHLAIYNRWGEIVFESFDMDSGWDGTYHGQRAMAGVYIWKVEAGLKSSPGEVNDFSGHVTLLR